MPDLPYPDILAIIPLRAGSKGLPGKNLKPLAGKPLFRHSLDQAKRVVGNCAVTTDIHELWDSESELQCKVVRRPPQLALDETPMAPVLWHLFDQLRERSALPKTAILLQATSPLRTDEDVRRAINLYNMGEFDLVMSTVIADPGILKFGIAEDGRFIPVSNPQYCFSNRQSLPQVVRPNGAIYVFSPETFLEIGSFPTGSIGTIEMSVSASIDIDSRDDFLGAEQILADQAFAKVG